MPTLEVFEARNEFAQLTPAERAEIRALAERLGVPVDDEHLPALLHVWKVWV